MLQEAARQPPAAETAKVSAAASESSEDSEEDADEVMADAEGVGLSLVLCTA